MAQKHFGEELRRLRRAANLTLADLADALGCSIAYVSDVERGVKNPPAPEAIRTLLEALGRPDLFGSMTTLAARSRSSVQINVANQRDEIVADMVVALARRCNENDIDPDVAKQILDLLSKQKPKREP